MMYPDYRPGIVMQHEHHDITASSPAIKHNHNVTPFLHYRLVGRIAVENYTKIYLTYTTQQSR